MLPYVMALRNPREPYESKGRWFVEMDCPSCLHMTVHQAASQRGPFECLRCARIKSEAAFDAQVVASLQRLGILTNDGRISGGIEDIEAPPF